MTPSRGTGDDALMPDERSFSPARIDSWISGLPAFARDAVATVDMALATVYVRAPAAPDRIRGLRTQVADWARQTGFAGDDLQDIVLAADEAVSNVVEHAYPDAPGMLTLFAGCTADTAWIVVSDDGRWRQPPADPGFRGRGLAMMHRLADSFRLAHTPTGTTVLLGWPLSG